MPGLFLLTRRLQQISMQVRFPPVISPRFPTSMLFSQSACKSSVGNGFSKDLSSGIQTYFASCGTPSHACHALLLRDPRTRRMICLPQRPRATFCGICGLSTTSRTGLRSQPTSFALSAFGLATADGVARFPSSSTGKKRRSFTCRTSRQFRSSRVRRQIVPSHRNS